MFVVLPQSTWRVTFAWSARPHEQLYGEAVLPNISTNGKLQKSGTFRAALNFLTGAMVTFRWLWNQIRLIWMSRASTMGFSAR